MFSSIWAFVKALPTLISILKEVFAFLQTIEDAIQRQKAADELKVAIKQARDSKDTSDLEDLFREGVNSSVHSPADDLHSDVVNSVSGDTKPS